MINQIASFKNIFRSFLFEFNIKYYSNLFLTYYRAVNVKRINFYINIYQLELKKILYYIYFLLKLNM